MSVAPQQIGGAGLRGFRLSEVDEKIRQAAADRVQDLLSLDVDAFARETSGEFSFVTMVLDAEKIARAARAPSDRVYWIPRKAWERVMKRP